MSCVEILDACEFCLFSDVQLISLFPNAFNVYILYIVFIMILN